MRLRMVKTETGWVPEGGDAKTRYCVSRDHVVQPERTAP